MAIPEILLPHIESRMSRFPSHFKEPSRQGPVDTLPLDALRQLYQRQMVRFPYEGSMYARYHRDRQIVYTQVISSVADIAAPKALFLITLFTLVFTAISAPVIMIAFFTSLISPITAILAISSISVVGVVYALIVAEINKSRREYFIRYLTK